MGMSTRVVGIIETTNQYKKMLSVYDACVKAEVTPPKEVEEFFNYELPERDGMIVKIKCQEYKSETKVETGLEIKVSDIAKSVTKIRFINSW